MNAVAGGGSFVSLPALIHAGLPSTVANASSTIGLFPGSIASLFGFRGARFEPPPGASRPVLLALSAAGGVIGAGLLLVTPPSGFDRILPWLLLAATLALLFGKPRREAAQAKGRPGVLYPLQFALGIYGGYFGGALGLMTMAAWLLIAGGELKRMTPFRVAVVVAANAVAVAIFLAVGAWRWRETLALLVGGVAGGWLGARLATRLPAKAVSWAVRVFAVAVTAAFFWRAYA
jgi:uncharacterized membrane protein YfcA